MDHVPIIRTERMSDFFMKYHVEGLPFAAVFHQFTSVDTGDPHDHPWGFRTFIVQGGYEEEVFNFNGTSEKFRWVVGDSVLVPATRVHRITKLFNDECWTLILPGPWEQKSGFYQWRDGHPWQRRWDEPDFQKIGT